MIFTRDRISCSQAHDTESTRRRGDYACAYMTRVSCSHNTAKCSADLPLDFSLESWKISCDATPCTVSVIVRDNTLRYTFHPWDDPVLFVLLTVLFCAACIVAMNWSIITEKLRPHLKTSRRKKDSQFHLNKEHNGARPGRYHWSV